TFTSTRANIRNYQVSSVQLYQIYCVPTWVAIYTQSANNSNSSNTSNDGTTATPSGDIYQAVGMVDARELNGSNVQFEADLASVLHDYQQWVTQQNIGCTTGQTSTGPTLTTIKGKVLRISSVQQGSNTVYYLQVEGYNMIFTANLTLSPKLPLVQV